ncbi:hypothetical protein BH20BAC1_BH20BAC1_03930 [soil metagenome]
MKLISFFSRVAIVCNIAFLLFAFIAAYQAGEAGSAAGEAVRGLSYFKNVIIILGISAIVINLIMCMVYAAVIIMGRQRILPKNLVILNFLFFLLQVFYYFFR